MPDDDELRRSDTSCECAAPTELESYWANDATNISLLRS